MENKNIEKRSYVYRHRRLDTNEIFYVGKGTKRKCKTFYTLKSEFLRAYESRGRNKYWNNITNFTEYRVEIIMDNLTSDEANELEIFLISIYKRFDCCGGMLVNATDGGEGVTGFSFSEETIEKMRKNNLGKIVSEDTKSKISKAGKGKKLSEEHKQKLSLAHTGKKMSQESVEKMRKNNTGKKLPTEVKKKMSGSRKGEKHPMAKEVLCILDGIFYSTIIEASVAYNLNYKTTYRKLHYNKINDSIFILT
jgi:hypothetical protein